MRKTLKQLVIEYGPIAVVVYLLLFFLTWTGFWAAIRLGWTTDGVAANLGAWTAAYIASKLTQPLRIAGTLALTPFIAKWYERGIAPLLYRLPGLRRRAKKSDFVRSSTSSTASPPAGA